MDKFVKNVFLVLLYATIAFVLYYIFFGNYNRQGVEVDGRVNDYVVSSNDASVRWKGVLFVAADNIQTSIAKYYYDYCYLPTVYDTEYIDAALGGSVITYGGDMSKIKTKLDSNNSAYDDGGLSTHYSEGWK